jgi:hypothetical protein
MWLLIAPRAADQRRELLSLVKHYKFMALGHLAVAEANLLPTGSCLKLSIRISVKMVGSSVNQGGNFRKRLGTVPGIGAKNSLR